jgi:hypothetical protein
MSPDCQNYNFSIQEQQEHMDKSHNGRYPGFFNCGSCEVHGFNKNAFKRKEKFEAHLRQHGIPEPINHNRFQCRLFSCCDSRISEGGLFFATQDDLNDHLRDDHSVLETADTIGPSEDCSKFSQPLIYPTIMMLTEPFNIEQKDHLVKSNLLRKSSKRSLDLSIDPSAKRPKPGTDTGGEI